LMTMISSIRAAGVPVATIAQGKAMSCGAALLSAGSPGYRYADPLSTIMIHDASLTDAGGRPDEVQASANEVQRLNTKFYSIMEGCSNKPRGYFEQLIHQKAHTDLYFSPRDAKKHGIIDHIKMPTLQRNVSVTWKLV